MKIYLITETDGIRKRVNASLPYHDADFATAPVHCTSCKTPSPIKVQGMRQRITADDRAYESDAVTVCCGTMVGTLRAEPATLFGIREDAAMARLNLRVY